MSLTLHPIVEADKTGTVQEKPTHLRVSSCTLRIDVDEPLIVGAVESGKIETVSLPDDELGNPRTAEIFVPTGQATALLKGAELDAILPKATREAIREAMIQNAKDNGGLEKIL